MLIQFHVDVVVDVVVVIFDEVDTGIVFVKRAVVVEIVVEYSVDDKILICKNIFNLRKYL